VSDTAYETGEFVNADVCQLCNKAEPRPEWRADAEAALADE
jgi:hypothetical protein